MDTDLPGKPQAFNDVDRGQFFAFRLTNLIAFGFKIVGPQLDDPRQVAVLHRGHPTKKFPPFFLDGRKASMPNIVHVLPAVLVCNWDNFDKMTDGVRNPEPGQIVVSADRNLIGVRDSDDDAIMVDLATGACTYQVSAPATVFSSWALELRRPNEKIVIYTFNIPQTGG